jgi:hypothetical protein
VIRKYAPAKKVSLAYVWDNRQLVKFLEDFLT